MEENIQDLHPSSGKINTLFSFDTLFSADSVEWCPHKPLEHFFVCGNYQLAQNENETEPSRKRLGRILLFSITPEDGLKLWQTLNTPAVLDQKWCHNKINGESILGVVNAEKKLEIYKLNFEKKELELITYYEIESDEEVLLLSLDWSTGKFSSEKPEIICSDSKGSWHRFVFVDNKLELQCSSHIHDYEAWIAAFYYWDTNVIFTGGDDCLLAKFDKRIGADPVLKNRTHEGGVTCIHSNAEKEYVLATGSYDEFLRLWDIRNMKQPSGQIKMPGPLWRLKWDPFTYNYLLAACMLGGAHIVDTEMKELQQLKIVESYYEHKNITYGADWCYLCEDDLNRFEHQGNRIIGTCSFYDHLLCVSKLCLT